MQLVSGSESTQGSIASKEPGLQIALPMAPSAIQDITSVSKCIASGAMGLYLITHFPIGIAPISLMNSSTKYSLYLRQLYSVPHTNEWEIFCSSWNSSN